MTNKEIAQDFLRLAANGHSQEGFSLYVGEEFKHHNAYFKGDAETLMLAMEESAITNPDKKLTIHHILEDGNLVAVHSHLQQNPTDIGFAVIHLLRFELHKIVELWDLGQPVPAETINVHGMF